MSSWLYDPRVLLVFLHVCGYLLGMPLLSWNDPQNEIYPIYHGQHRVFEDHSTHPTKYIV